ncbi:MAG: phosphoenolpyruvate--protein phosphotransferase [Acidobacteria bacterium]|jgi:phosphotransferase system enzyme I (PtsI)|nr:phosphoenolpyruvate--protein phosphotransferase [Acidobacteriota bacterium]
MVRIKGKAVSPGIAMGKALLYNFTREVVLAEPIGIKSVEREIWRLDNAVKKSRAQLKKIHLGLQKIMGADAAFIIETQHMLLSDSHLLGEIRAAIQGKLVKAEWAIRSVEKKYLELFRTIPDLSFKAKSNDISDVLNRLIANLRKSSAARSAAAAPAAPPGQVILVADDITPSEAATLMSNKRLLGLVLNKGGETSHTAILARTLGIPAILDTGNATELIASGDTLAVDSIGGEVIVQPSADAALEIGRKIEQFTQYKEQLKVLSRLPELTRDQHQFHLYANIELPFESEVVQSFGAKGIGLFRTEFLYLDSKMSISEDEQCLIYKQIAQNIYPHPLVIRTYDLGRDKSDPARPRREDNPSLGLMAVRLFLKEREPFKVQIRAIMRANASGNIRILFPMITEIEEVLAIREIMAEAKKELQRAGTYPKKDVKTGIMLEIPAAVRLIRHLGDAVDFYSVGSNDLIQYLLAVDRNNTDVAHLFSPFHPAFIHILREIRAEVDRAGKEVTVCGEMAGQRLTALMLLGMGFTNFSMNAMAIAEIKKAFTQIDYARLRRIVAQLKRFGSRTEVEAFLRAELEKQYPGVLASQGS